MQIIVVAVIRMVFILDSVVLRELVSMVVGVLSSHVMIMDNGKWLNGIDLELVLEHSVRIVCWVGLVDVLRGKLVSKVWIILEGMD